MEGNVLTLQAEANRTVNNAVVRHNDTLALQEAMDRAVKEKLNVFVPTGYYMLPNLSGSIIRMQLQLRVPVQLILFLISVRVKEHVLPL